MNIQDIYEKLQQIGVLTFATVEDGSPQTHMGQVFACDKDGLYFVIPLIASFYTQLQKNGKVALSGTSPDAKTICQANGTVMWESGYSISLSGTVKEIDFDDLDKKAARDPNFDAAFGHILQHPAITVFCIHRCVGELYELGDSIPNDPPQEAGQPQGHRSLKRTPFSFGGAEPVFRGVRITETCMSCGKCIAKCPFQAIYKVDEEYRIDNSKCNICGDCHSVCPARAIEAVTEG